MRLTVNHNTNLKSLKYKSPNQIVLIECDRQTAGRRLNNDAQKGFKSPCGTALQVSNRVGRCMDPVFDLIEGRVNEAKGDSDMIANCNRFNGTERCVRTIAKDCLSGIQKTSTSAVSFNIRDRISPLYAIIPFIDLHFYLIPTS